MCVFCDYDEDKIIYKNDAFYIVWDIDPIQDGHLLLIPIKHYKSISEIPNDSLAQITIMLKKIVEIYENRIEYYGCTIMQTNGKTMDVNHVHFHIFPRYLDDNFILNDSIPIKEITKIKSLIIKDIKGE